ncbi:MAG: Pvc16 family protein [Calditrichota bacterium]
MSRIHGCTISTLNAFPILTREAIRNIIKPRSSYDFLSTSDLADQVEQVKINLMTLSLEELSKLWTVFYQTTHRLSIAYQLSVILIDADLSPEQALPAQRINLHSTPGSMPVIKNVLPSKLFYRKSATLEVLGEHLSKPDYITRVYLNGSEGRTEFLSTDKLKVELPDNVAAGPLKVQVFLEQNSGRSDSAIEGSSIISSNSVYSSVLPTLKSPAHLYSGTDPQNPMSQIRTVVVQAIPDLNITQQGRLWLNLQEATYSSQNASSAFPVLRFICPESFSADLNEGRITGELISFFKGNNIALSSTSQITVHTENKNWLLRDQQSQQLYSIRRQGDHLMVYFGFGIPMYDISNSSAFLVEADLELVSGKYYVRLDVGTDQVMESNVNYNENTPVLDIE